jgi:hypothetical protein
MHGGLTLWLKVETRRCRSGSVGLSSESRCDENINPVVCVSAGSAGPFFSFRFSGHKVTTGMRDGASNANATQAGNPQAGAN